MGIVLSVNTSVQAQSTELMLKSSTKTREAQVKGQSMLGRSR
jgi:hypothetical protein